jgi:hypothetical protein
MRTSSVVVGSGCEARSRRVPIEAASSTMLFDSGRQRLTGNVGYRVIEANEHR